MGSKEPLLQLVIDSLIEPNCQLTFLYLLSSFWV